MLWSEILGTFLTCFWKFICTECICCQREVKCTCLGTEVDDKIKKIRFLSVKPIYFTKNLDFPKKFLKAALRKYVLYGCMCSFWVLCTQKWISLGFVYLWAVFLFLQSPHFMILESVFNLSTTWQNHLYNNDSTHQAREISIKSYLNACSKNLLNEWICFHLF